MPELPDHQQKIDKYLQDRLSPEQKFAFQKQLEEDKELANLLERQQQLADGIRLSALRKRLTYYQELSSNLDKEVSLEEDTLVQAYRHQRNLEVMERLKGKGEAMEKEKKKSVFHIRRWVIAATLITSLGIGFIWLGKQYSSQQLVEDAYYPINLSEVRKETNRPNELTEAINYYNLGDYKKALKTIKDLNTTSVEGDLLSGHIHLRLNQVDKAINNFSKVIQSNDLRFYENAKWHLGLTYLLKGDIGNTKKIMESFQKGTTPKFKNQSNRILNKLDSPLWNFYN